MRNEQEWKDKLRELIGRGSAGISEVKAPAAQMSGQHMANLQTQSLR